ncbi:peptide MFS transporter [Priestia megaterium]|jgi:proton-dependent oligopeptide transporter, POT family|uniref:Amino acid/peptide transporter (Peptide:H+ symporter) n=4 Tax=Priestia megaterium TaxID=1404 RepID=D5DLD6_PRIM3|nr:MULTISPECIES: peptide MFS transporter [Priestia]MCJ7990732.1 peptide MFS transporter [Priestia sp. OVS21]ADF41264.1 amino acid/peptide transporter (Peptide:H+ symporter) [Priestia megaterium DSM 319]AJI23555.1 amino acid/peptide transporter family protein [Priestia megaterium NBRC 15308 = ATCC 14581]AYE49271.1 peptide MFS transporter [Priestia megaterium NCT-2]KFN00104.1 amino acid/peptide transporter family protein [Priestia megaterium]
MQAAVQHENQQPNGSRKKHPPGLYLLFATEAWERFSYYGMRAILVLYLTATAAQGGLGVDKATALSLYGTFTSAVYITPMIGGYLTDRFLGRRLAITIGGVIMALGNFSIFIHQSVAALYIGLALLIIGNGFFKPNISTLVGDLYEENDPRRDGAFTIFYMGINFGAFFAPLVVGLMSYKYGFLTAAIGMVVGQILFNLLANRYLGDIGKEPTGKVHAAASQTSTAPLSAREKKRTVAIVILAFVVIAFWTAFEQAGSSLTLYAQDQINRQIGSFTVPTEWFQSLNPLFIMILAPIMSLVWYKLGNSKRGDFKTPTKMGMGLVTVGLGFLILIPAVMYTGNDPALKVNILFMIFTYFLHTLAELMISPVGLSMVSRLAPLKLASLLMGVWMASSAVANKLAGVLASYTQSLGYFDIFSLIGAVTIVLGIIVLFLSKPIAKLMD